MKIIPSISPAGSKKQLDAASTSCVACILPLVLLLALPAAIQAQFQCTTNNGTITIIGYTGPGGAVIIPDTTNGLPVTGIGPGAFQHKSTVNSVTLPNNVTSIGDGAFVYCTTLTNVTLGTNLASIGHNAFDNCTSLTSATLPDSVTNIGMEAFFYCTSLTSLTLPNSITDIGTNQFEDCFSLTGVTLPNSVTSIDDSAFDNDASLTNITIPGGVTNIGWLAFDGCRVPRSVYFKGSAPKVNIQTFWNSPSTTLYYLPGTTNWGPTLGGRPAVLWNPQAQPADSSFGVLTNGFGFNITGTTNIPMVIEACTDLANSTWFPLQTCTLTNGSIYFSDAQWTHNPGRFYRIRSP